MALRTIRIQEILYLPKMQRNHRNDTKDQRTGSTICLIPCMRQTESDLQDHRSVFKKNRSHRYRGRPGCYDQSGDSGKVRRADRG